MLPESEPIEHGPSDEPLITPNTEHSVFPRTVRMTLHILPDATRTLKFPHNARILVGRADDEETANDLMLELSHYGGESNGVSRVHAAIHDQEGMSARWIMAHKSGDVDGAMHGCLSLPPRLSGAFACTHATAVSGAGDGARTCLPILLSHDYNIRYNL